MSIEEFDRQIPVRPPIVNKKIKPSLHSKDELNFRLEPYRVASQLKILIPVGMAIIIVAAVKYARVSMSMLIVNMWWAQTINPIVAILTMA